MSAEIRVLVGGARGPRRGLPAGRRARRGPRPLPATARPTRGGPREAHQATPPPWPPTGRGPSARRKPRRLLKH
eukprot:1948901-Alexandrium_andersonii.AAC.1